GERLRVTRHDPDATSGREETMDDRNEQQAGGEHGDTDRCGHLPLELHEEPAVGGDGAHTFPFEIAGGLDEDVEQTLGAAPNDQVRRGAAHPVIAHRKRKRGGVPHVARNAREARVEHQHADREAEDVLTAADFTHLGGSGRPPSPPTRPPTAKPPSPASAIRSNISWLLIPTARRYRAGCSGSGSA